MTPQPPPEGMGHPANLMSTDTHRLSQYPCGSCCQPQLVLLCWPITDRIQQLLQPERFTCNLLHSTIVCFKIGLRQSISLCHNASFCSVEQAVLHRGPARTVFMHRRQHATFVGADGSSYTNLHNVNCSCISYDSSQENAAFEISGNGLSRSGYRRRVREKRFAHAQMSTVRRKDMSG